MFETLLAKLRGKQAVIGVVGLGYVGLPIMLRFHACGFRVIGLDIDAKKIDSLNAGKSYIGHIDDARIKAMHGANFEVSTDFAKSREADALIICVPTPLSKQREPDMSFVLSTLEALTPHLRAGQIISLESTTYPGTTDEVLAPQLKALGLTTGQDVFLVYSPEREDPGNSFFDTQSIPKIVGGYTQNCLEVGCCLYEQIIEKIVPVSSTKTAELTKLLENIHRAVNIGLVNEMKLVADAMGVDIFEVIEAASTKPFGFTPYYPGPGIGGHCLPVDPFYLTWKAREFGVHTRFIELTGEINRAMPHYVVSKTADALNAQRKTLKDSKILVLGLAYKKNVDDPRESPSVEIMQLLRAKGAHIDYSDPHIRKFPHMRAHKFALESVELNAQTIQSYDAVILATAHDGFDYTLIRKNAQMIVDTRGYFRAKNDMECPKIIRA